MIKVNLSNVIIIGLIAVIFIVVLKFIVVRYPVPEPIKNLFLSV